MADKTLTSEYIKNWLIEYAWLGPYEEQLREVDCIMAQDDWRYIEARIEKYRGQAWDDKQAFEAEGFALSGLYETHTAPHLKTCPRYEPEEETT